MTKLAVARPICLVKLPTRNVSRREVTMTAYLVVELEITNAAAMKAYVSAVPAMVAQYGGRYLTRGGPTELIRRRPQSRTSSS